MGGHLLETSTFNSDLHLNFISNNFGAPALRLRYPAWTIFFMTMGYTITFLVGIAGNSLVIILVKRLPNRLRTSTNWFLCNLAIADFFVLIFCAFPNLVGNIYVEWVLGYYLCKFLPYAQGVSVHMCISLHLIGYISREAHQNPEPFTTDITTRQASLIILSIWTWALLVPIPWALFFQIGAFYPDYPNHLFCIDIWPEHMKDGSKYYFLVGNFIICYLFPFIIILISYLLICWAVFRHERAPYFSRDCQCTRQHRERISMVKTLFVMTFTFFITWLPLYSITLLTKLSSVESSKLGHEIIHYVFPIAQFLGVFGSAANPFIYGFRRREYIMGCLDMTRESSSLEQYTTNFEEYDNVRLDLLKPPMDGENNEEEMHANEGHILETAV